MTVVASRTRLVCIEHLLGTASVPTAKIGVWLSSNEKKRLGTLKTLANKP